MLKNKIIWSWTWNRSTPSIWQRLNLDLQTSNLILALLPIGPALHSISSNFCSSIFICWSSTRTELVQKWSLLVRIRTSMERISICFFEPGDLRFRPDSGQMEEDLDEVQIEQLNLIMFALEDLQQARSQSEEDLISGDPNYDPIIERLIPIKIEKLWFLDQRLIFSKPNLITLKLNFILSYWWSWSISSSCACHFKITLS